MKLELHDSSLLLYSVFVRQWL